MANHTRHYRRVPNRRLSHRATAAQPLVVMPTYNESANIREMLPQIMHYRQFQVLVVDDSSTDGTADAVRDAMRNWPDRIHLIEREAKLGLGTAYIAGFRWALARDYTHVFEMDADFSHHPATLPRMLQASKHADLVIGSRYVPGGRTVNWSPVRKLISRGGSTYARAILGLPVRDLTGGFKCFRRQVLESMDLDRIESTGYAFQIELTYRAALADFNIAEIPITFAERLHGTSKMSSTIVVEAMYRVLQLRWEAGTRWAPAHMPAAAAE